MILKKNKDETGTTYYIGKVRLFKKKKRLLKIIQEQNKQLLANFQEVQHALRLLDKRVILSNVIAKTHQETFAGKKNSNYGKDVVLVATGASLKNYKPIKDAIHIGVNRAYKYDKVKLDAIFVQDRNIGSDHLRAIDNYCKNHKSELFVGITCGHEISEAFAILSKAKRYYTDIRCAPNWKFALNIELEELGDFHSVAFAAMQYILYTNPKRIYLAGCDAFTNGYFFGGKNILDDNLVLFWKSLKEFANKFYPETKIISVNPVGLKRVFKDMYQS